MKKILFTATVDSHIKNFHIPFLKWFKENGYEVHVASNGESFIPYVDFKYNIPFSRSPISSSNIKACKELKSIVDLNNFEIVHCHTPIAGLLTRIVVRKSRKKGTSMLYTAHGFHFYKGAPAKNWILYYPLEKIVSYVTDLIITINEEDYRIANKRFLCDEVKLVNGVGVDLKKFGPISGKEKLSLREKYGYKENDFILIYVAELSKRKQQHKLIEAISELKHKLPNIKLLLVGEGDLELEYVNQAKKSNTLSEVEFLGYRNDVSNLMKISDICVSSSRQEGLPLNIMEAMATGLPIVATDCRGNRDLVEVGRNGFLVKKQDNKGFSDYIYNLSQSPKLHRALSRESLNIVERYSLDIIMQEMVDIYEYRLKDAIEQEY